MTVEDEPSIIGASGEITPEDVQKAVQWVRLNKDLLSDLWDQHLRSR